MTMNMGFGAAAEWVVGSLLTKGKVLAAAILTGATNTTDLLCAGDSLLTVEVDMNGAANADLAVTVVPFETDGTTLLANAPLPAIRSSGPTFGGSTVNFTATYDVSGVDKVRIIVKNNNAGTQTLNRMSWRLS
jgi:hypothetical protein